MACCKRAMLCETGRQPSHRFSLILFDNTKISPQHVKMSHPLNCLFIGGMDGNRYPFRLLPDKVLQEVSQFCEIAHHGRQSWHRTASRSSSEHSPSSQADKYLPFRILMDLVLKNCPAIKHPGECIHMNCPW